GGVDAEWRSVEAAERDAMLLVSIERSHASTAQRIVGVGALIAHRAQIALMAGVGDAELIRAGEYVAGRVRVRVEALQFELRSKPRVAADVHAVVLREALAIPDAEAGEGREAAASGGWAAADVRCRRIERIAAESERNVLV